MHPTKIFIYSIILLFPLQLIAETLPDIGLSKELMKKIEDGLVHSDSVVKNLEDGKKQSLDFVIAGLHKKSCTFALRKLSLYENFHNYMGMVETSQYDEKQQKINLLLSHSILPFRMRLKFKIPRITEPGSYPFFFDTGFLKGLNGKIHVYKYKNRCLFHTTATWKGKHSGFAPTFFEFFSSAAAKHSMEILFRVSSTY